MLGTAASGLALALKPNAARSGAQPLRYGEREPNPDAARARETGRGRRATSPSPWQIPWRGWKDIFLRTYKEIQEDRLLAVAAGVVFFGLLAFFPAVTAFVSLYGLFVDPGTIRDHLDLAASVMPAGAVQILREQVERIVSKPPSTLGFAFLVSIGIPA